MLSGSPPRPLFPTGLANRTVILVRCPMVAGTWWLLLPPSGFLYWASSWVLCQIPSYSFTRFLLPRLAVTGKLTHWLRFGNTLVLVDTLSTSRLYGVHARSEPGMAQPVVGSCLCHINLRLLLLDYGLLRMILELLFGYSMSSQLFHLVYAGNPRS